MKIVKRKPNPPDGVPGWYDDPDGSGLLVYFDGTAWTDATMARLDSPTYSPPLINHGAPRPAASHYPWTLYVAAARGVRHPGGRTSRAAFVVFLVTNSALITAYALANGPELWTVFPLALAVHIAASIPRLHDGGHAGTQLWWLPALVLPLVGWYTAWQLASKVFGAGQKHHNFYGPVPR